MSEKEEKKKKRIGWIIAFTFNALLILVLFAFNMPETDPPPPKPLIVLDFTAGSVSKGGRSSASKPTETPTKNPDPSPVDPVKTQEKSPITKSNQKKGDNSSESSTTESTKKANPNASADGAFGGDGSGKSNGNGNGDKDGIGDGKSGPGPSGKIGKLGTGEGKAPTIYNPTKEEGKVAIKITIDRNGKIVDVKVLSNHKRTTTNSPALLAKAKKDGFKFTFKPDANRKELTSGIRIINYILQ